MVPFLASPRKGPHIQMAHYSSIWLCILHKNFIPMLNNQHKQYRCYYFSWGSLSVCSRDLVSVTSFGSGSLTQASETASPSLINISALCLFLGSAALIYTKVWFVAKQLSVLPWLQLCFSNVHLCVVRVTARKYLSGSSIETEGEISISKQTAKQVSAASRERGQKRIGTRPWPPQNPSFISTYNLLL